MQSHESVRWKTDFVASCRLTKIAHARLALAASLRNIERYKTLIKVCSSSLRFVRMRMGSKLGSSGGKGLIVGAHKPSRLVQRGEKLINNDFDQKRPIPIQLLVCPPPFPLYQNLGLRRQTNNRPRLNDSRLREGGRGTILFNLGLN